MAVLQLGDFVLDEVIGRGGMGEIWRARHQTLGTPVAIKVDLHPPDGAYAAAFLHEVQLIASLDHPHVVKILDHGAVPEGAGGASDGRLQTGSRWLAMELAAGGALADRPPRNWAEVRHVVDALLGGLAHAHSRGLVHRDIKAGNLLIAGPEPGITIRPKGLLDARIVLSDFGISGRADADAHSSAGTPKLMAPEQIHGHWRDQGPWTDLYAVGILLWRMVTGRYPFSGKNKFQIIKQHLTAPLPPFRPRMGTPVGLERLLGRLLTKDHRGRFPFAADVLAELQALGDAHGDAEVAPSADEPTEQTTRQTSTGGLSTSAALSRFEGAGLSMWGLRSPPLVGRDAACRALMAALGRVESQRRSHLVMVRGPAGAGRTRMGQWIGREAHASGRAFVFDAKGTSTEEEPLVEMVRRATRATHLVGEELVERLESVFPGAPFDLKALVALLSPKGQGGPSVRGSWRHVLVQAALTALVRDRVGVVVLDDAHLAHDFLAFADQVLGAQGLRPSPLLLVLTVRDEALDEEAEASVVDLLDDPATTVVRLDGLGPLDHQRLIRGLVGLSGSASAAVEDHTRGNPLFAVQLIDAWLQQGVLQPSTDGLALTCDPGLPKDLLAVWGVRVDAALDELTEREALTVEVAAALGEHVDLAVWSAAVDELGGASVDTVMPLLVRRHWARTSGDQDRGLTFVHALLLEALTERARRATRWRRVNAVAADALLAHSPRQVGRIARLRVEAGEHASSLPFFAKALELQIAQSDLRREHHVNQMERALQEIPDGTRSPWRGRLDVVRATRMRMRGEPEEAARMLVDVVESATRYAWTTERGRALRELARCRLALGDFDATGAAAQQALDHFLATGDEMRAADCQKILADSASRRGDFATARTLFEACATTYAALSPDELYGVMFALALLERRAGRPEVSRQYLARCRAVVEPVGWQGALGSIANLEGEIARDLGDLPGAIAAYTAAGESFRACGSPEYTYPILNIGLLDLEAERYASAVQRVLPVRGFAVEKKLAMVVLYADLVLMAGYAGLGETTDAAEALQRVEDFVTPRELADPDVGKLCAKAGRLFGRDELVLAFRSSMLAHAQYTKCGRDKAAAEVAAFMGELQG